MSMRMNHGDGGIASQSLQRGFSKPASILLGFSWVFFLCTYKLGMQIVVSKSSWLCAFSWENKAAFSLKRFPGSVQAGP